jgi:2-phospho-L-lactate/phosphoenolpyruvate guanylyltransferase
MATIVVPFRGSGAKLRLTPLAEPDRSALALAMLGDVLSACRPVAETLVVAEGGDVQSVVADVGVRLVDDPGEGQGAAVAAALAGVGAGPVLVVNADVPSVVPHDLRALLRATSAGGIAIVPAADGTTNALGLPGPQAFAPLYGPGSAGRFRAHAAALGLEAVAVAIPSLADDVDTIEDLRRLGLRAGPRTQAAIANLGLAA